MFSFIDNQSQKESFCSALSLHVCIHNIMILLDCSMLYPFYLR